MSSHPSKAHPASLKIISRGLGRPFTLLACLAIAAGLAAGCGPDPVSSGAGSAREDTLAAPSSNLDGIERKRRRDEYFHMLLRDPSTDRIPEGIRLREQASARLRPTYESLVAATLGKVAANTTYEWREVGPNDVGGRTRAFVVDVTDQDVLIAGGVSGGIWRSTDRGATWRQVSENDVSVTSIVQDTRAGETHNWYASTGELRESFSNNGQFTGPLFGNGLYKSTDGGNSWSRIQTAGSPAFVDTEFDRVGRIVISPTTGTIVMASSSDGLFRSTDGGATFIHAHGTSEQHPWSDVVAGASGVFIGVLSGPSGASTNGLYRSVDDGASWQPLSGADPLRVPTIRSVMALAPSNQDLLYVMTYMGADKVVSGTTVEDVRFHKVTLSTAVFEDLSANIPFLPRSVGDEGNGTLDTQGGYNMAIAVHPTDPSHVFMGGTSLFRSRDGFATPVSDLDGWIGGYAITNNNNQYINHHPDQHALFFDPFEPDRLYSGHDGGLSVADDVTPLGPVAWTDLNNGYNVTQLYHVSLAQASGDNRVLGATQDNGSPWFRFFDRTGTTSTSVDISSGDGAWSYIAAWGYLASSQEGGLSYQARNPGDTPSLWRTHFSPCSDCGMQFINPGTVEPNDEKIIFYPAGSDLYRSRGTDGREGWDRLAKMTFLDDYRYSALTVSTNPRGVLYVAGFKPSASPKIFRLDAAETSAVAPVERSISLAPSGAYILEIAVNPDDADEILVAISNYGVASLWHSTDGGVNYTDVEGNLAGADGPSIKTAEIAVFGSGKTYFVGTSTGVYAAAELKGSGTVWGQVAVGVVDQAPTSWLTSRTSDGRLAVGTHGRGVFMGFASPPTPANRAFTLAGDVTISRAGDQVIIHEDGKSAISIPIDALNRLSFSGPISATEFTIDYSGGSPIPSGGLWLVAQFWSDTFRFLLDGAAGTGAGTPPISVFGGGGPDTFEVDFGGGSPVIDEKMQFHGSDGDDRLILKNGVYSEIRHVQGALGFGSVSFDGPGGLFELEYTFMEMADDLLRANTRTFAYEGGDETITVTTDAATADRSIIETNLGGTVTFRNPNTVFNLEAGDGDDSIVYWITDPNFWALPSLFGGDGLDFFSVKPHEVTPISVFGDAPAGFPGDVLELELAGVEGVATLGTRFWVFNNRENVEVDGIETVTQAVTASGATTVRIDGPDLVLTDAAGNEVFRGPANGPFVPFLRGSSGDDSFVLDLTSGDPLPPGGLQVALGDGDDLFEIRVAPGMAPPGPVVVFGGDGDDVLRMDFQGGAGILPDNISFHGGAGSDQVELDGGVFDAMDYTFVSENDGGISFSGPLGQFALTYTGLEPIMDNGLAGTRMFTFSGADDTITLADDGVPGDNKSFIDSDIGGEIVTFTNPITSLTVNAGSGDDTIVFLGLDSAAPAVSIFLNGDLGDDNLAVAPSATHTVAVDGGAPTTCPGDRLTFSSGTPNPPLQPGSGTVSFTGSEKDVAYASIELFLGSSGDLSVDLVHIKDTAWASDQVIIQVTVTNLGSAAVSCVTVDLTGVASILEIDVDNSSGLLTPAATSGTFDKTTLLWTVTTVPAGGTQTLSIPAVVNTALSGPFDSTARVSTLGTDTDPTNDESTGTLTVLDPFVFPVKAQPTAAEFEEDLAGEDRLLIGLFQGSPGLDSALLCRFPAPDGDLFTAVIHEKLHRTCSEGLPYPLAVNDIWRDPDGAHEGRIWLTSWGWGGLYYTDDVNGPWTAVEPTPGIAKPGWVNVYAITEDATDDILYISANNGLLFRSLNGGGIWQRVSSLPGVAKATAWSLIAHPTVPGTLYAGTFGLGVYVSTDFGYTWEEISGNAALLPANAGHIFDLEIIEDDSVLPSDFYLYAGTGRGVWWQELTAPAPAWTFAGPVVPGLSSPEIRSLAVGMDASGIDGEPDLYAASWGLGVFRLVTPFSGGTLSPFGLRTGNVTMLAVAPGGRVVAATEGGGLVQLEASFATAVDAPDALPTGYVLEQNYPNPFNPVTTIRYQVPEAGRIRVAVFDLLGREVALLVEGLVEAGHHEASFDATGLPSGTYVYRMEAPGINQSRLLTLLK